MPAIDNTLRTDIHALKDSPHPFSRLSPKMVHERTTCVAFGGNLTEDY